MRAPCGKPMPGHPDITCARHAGHDEEKGDLGHKQSRAGLQGDGAEWPNKPARPFERVIMCCEFAKQPMTRPTRIVLIQGVEGGDKCSVHTEYKIEDGEGWARANGAYGLTPCDAVREFTRRVLQNAEWYRLPGTLARVEKFVGEE